MNILILHGPNLNLLGEREPEVYGKTTLNEINHHLRLIAKPIGVKLKILQSNHEGTLIDMIHAERHDADAIIINPGAFTHYSYAIRDALTAYIKPVYEVHLSDLGTREEFRKFSVLDGLPNVTRIMGLGAQSYYAALEKLTQRENVTT